MTDWSVYIEASGPEGSDAPTDAALDDFLTELSIHAAVVTGTPEHSDRGRYGARLTIDSELDLSAVERARTIFRHAVYIVDLPDWPIVRIEALTHDELDRELGSPDAHESGPIELDELRAALDRAFDESPDNAIAWPVLQPLLDNLRDTGAHPETALAALHALDRLVGLAEVAELLEVSRQRASQITSKPDFPGPIVRLRSGPVWRQSDVERHQHNLRARHDRNHPPSGTSTTTKINS